LSVIISASQAEDTDAVSASIGALRKVGGPDAVYALLPLLKHHSRQVWLSAAVALSEIDGQEAVAGILDLQPERILDPAVLNALARLNFITQAASALRTALEQAPHENRVAALEVLAKVAPADQVAPLQDHFAQIYAAELNDEKWAVRNRAVDSLGQIGGTLALKALKEQLKNEADYDIRCVIEKILGLKDRGDAGGELGQG
jgi:HEAT repeat protein